MREVQQIHITDKNYPEKLKNIYDPPIIIYALGNIEILNYISVAVIGSREPTFYGKKVASEISYNLSKNNVTVISGMAKGIDGEAHIGALKAQGKTIAVLGSGLDCIYPKENEYLFNAIIKNDGVIISEYPLGTKPKPTNFPRRNRIISGLSNGVLVVEAKERSGTLITVDFALEQGKMVYAIPGDINKYNSKGTNNLIKEGAKPVTNVDDILEELKYEFKIQLARHNK